MGRDSFFFLFLDANNFHLFPAHLLKLKFLVTPLQQSGYELDLKFMYLFHLFSEGIDKIEEGHRKNGLTSLSPSLFWTFVSLLLCVCLIFLSCSSLFIFISYIILSFFASLSLLFLLLPISVTLRFLSDFFSLLSFILT